MHAHQAHIDINTMNLVQNTINTASRKQLNFVQSAERRTSTCSRAQFLAQDPLLDRRMNERPIENPVLPDTVKTVEWAQNLSRQQWSL